MDKIDNEPKPLKAKLWINDCPFEHVVIPRQMLAPEIEENICFAVTYRNAARAMLITGLGFEACHQAPSDYLKTITACLFTGGTFWQVLGILQNNFENDKNSKGGGYSEENSFPMVSRYIGIVISLTVLGICIESGKKAYANNTTLKGAFDFAGACMFFVGAALNYHWANQITAAVGKRIEKLVDNGYTPFPGINQPAILSAYDSGFIDNHGNLVLVKHPNSVHSAEQKGLMAFKQSIQYHQPFQRKQFKLKKPELRNTNNVKNTSFVPA